MKLQSKKDKDNYKKNINYKTSRIDTIKIWIKVKWKWKNKVELEKDILI